MTAQPLWGIFTPDGVRATSAAFFTEQQATRQIAEWQDRQRRGERTDVDASGLFTRVIRRRCAYCDEMAVPGLRHHMDYPVCPKHETPEQDMALFREAFMDDLSESERLELHRLRKFIRRLGYVRSHMAAGDQAIVDALIDDRYSAVLAGLDRAEPS